MAVFTIDGATSATTEPLDLTNAGPYSFHVVYTGLDGINGIASVEYSNDGVNFSQVPDLTDTLMVASGQSHFNINEINHKYYRLRWVAGTNTAGTLVVTTSK